MRLVTSVLMFSTMRYYLHLRNFVEVNINANPPHFPR